MSTNGFSERLSEVMAGRSKNAFAKLVGVSEGAIRQYLEGSLPGIDKAAMIALRTGVRLNWLILGEGPKMAKALDQPGPSDPTFDGELLGRVVDRVARVYRELGVSLPDVELGRLSAEKYAEIREIAADPEEWPPALDLMALRLRRAVLQAATEPGSSKSRA